MDRNKIADCIAQGLTVGEMAKLFDCTQAALLAKIQKLGLRFSELSESRWTEDRLREIVQKSRVARDVLLALGLKDKSTNYRTLYYYLALWNIDTAHWETPSVRKRRVYEEVDLFGRTPLVELLVENGSDRNNGTIKRRLFKAGLKQPYCEMPGCGQGEIWMGKRMTLILDHINGNPSDNRLENLRIVCPNCNATLPTHCGRRNNKQCEICHSPFIGEGQTCGEEKCIRELLSLRARQRTDRKPFPQLRKVKNRPTLEQLWQDTLQLRSIEAVGKKYGVSGNSVRKWVRAYGADPAELFAESKRQNRIDTCIVCQVDFERPGKNKRRVCSEACLQTYYGDRKKYDKTK